MGIYNFIFWSKLAIGFIFYFVCVLNATEIALMLVHFVEAIFPMFSDYFYSKTIFRVFFYKDIVINFLIITKDSVLNMVKYSILNPIDPKELKELYKVNHLVSLDIEHDPVFIKVSRQVSNAFFTACSEELNIEIDKAGVGIRIEHPRLVFPRPVLFVVFFGSIFCTYEVISIAGRILTLFFN